MTSNTTQCSNFSQNKRKSIQASEAVKLNSWKKECKMEGISDETEKTKIKMHARKNKPPKIQKKWKAVFNVIRFTKQKQKVRFLVDPCMAMDICECPIEAQNCTVDESMIHYVDSITKTEIGLCTKERYTVPVNTRRRWDVVWTSIVLC